MNCWRGIERARDADKGRQVGVDGERADHAQQRQQGGQGPARAVPQGAGIRVDGNFPSVEAERACASQQLIWIAARRHAASLRRQMAHQTAMGPMAMTIRSSSVVIATSSLMSCSSSAISPS